MLLESGCNVPSGGWSCCTSTNQCGIGEGDCDTDSDCSGNLKCGTNNCDTALGFPSAMDCCYQGKEHKDASSNNSSLVPPSLMYNKSLLSEGLRNLNSKLID